MDDSNDDAVHLQGPSLGRRDLIKLGAGVVVTTLNGVRASAQGGASGTAQGQTAGPAPVPPSRSLGVVTRAGYKNDANRSSGNGPMDNTSRQIVEYVRSFSESSLTPPVVHALGRTMVDSMAALIAGFESEPARICARLARTVQSDLKCTVLGYGVTTSPELAAFANGCMLRHTDFNDLGPGGHLSDIISGILAIGEALHSSGL